MRGGLSLTLIELSLHSRQAAPEIEPAANPLVLSSASCMSWNDGMPIGSIPPCQYKDIHCLVHRTGVMRVPDVSERELMMGFPLRYTANCSPKSERKGRITTIHD